MPVKILPFQTLNSSYEAFPIEAAALNEVDLPLPLNFPCFFCCILNMYSAMHQTYSTVPGDVKLPEEGHATWLCVLHSSGMYYPFPKSNITFLNWKNSFVEESPNENQC